MPTARLFDESEEDGVAENSAEMLIKSLFDPLKIPQLSSSSEPSSNMMDNYENIYRNSVLNGFEGIGAVQM
jgi:hypothetical protein